MTATNNTFRQILPVGSEIVTYENGKHKWYTTKRIIDVENPEPANCPLREIECVTMTHKGFQVWFMESQVKVILSAEQESTTRNMKLVKLEYDIPTRVMARGELEHPSGYLWARGVRTTKSCWLLPEGNIPYARLRELTRTGCTWEVTKIDATDSVNHMQRAIAALQTEWVQAFVSREECLASALTRRNDGEGDITKKDQRYRADLKRIEKEFEKRMENVRNGANALNIPIHWVQGSSMRAILRATVISNHSEYKNRAEEFGKASENLRKIGTEEANSLASHLDNDTVHAGVVADYLAEHDEDTYSLRDVIDDK